MSGQQQYRPPQKMGLWTAFKSFFKDAAVGFLSKAFVAVVSSVSTLLVADDVPTAGAGVVDDPIAAGGYIAVAFMILRYASKHYDKVSRAYALMQQAQAQRAAAQQNGQPPRQSAYTRPAGPPPQHPYQGPPRR